MALVDLGVEGLSEAEPVGEGGNAVVYRAREVDHDRWVAVKVLRGLGDEGALRRFDRERRAMGRLSEHEGIVTIYSSGFTEKGEPYLVMPLLPISLQDQLDRAGRTPWPEAAELMATVARTVHVAHEEGVIHRDLKPANILLSRGGAPLVADFGIATLTGRTIAAQSTAMTFTPSYSPPEVLEGAAPSKAADIYALGATLFALIAGAPPFTTDRDESVFALMQRIATQPVADLRSLPVPDRICAVIEEAMSKNPDHRFATAADFATALEDPTHEPRQAVHDPPPDRTRAAGDDHRSPSRTGATTVVTRDRVRPPSPSPGDEGEQRSSPRRRRRFAAIGVVGFAVAAALAAFVVVQTRDDPTSTVGDRAPAVIDTITVGAGPFRSLEANDLIWVPNLNEGSVSVIDPTTRAVVDTITVGAGPVRSLAANDLIWVPNRDDGSVSVIDPATRAVVDTISVGDGPFRPLAANDLIWVPITLGDTVSVIDPATRTVVDTITVEVGPFQPIAAHGLIWVPSRFGDSVSVIDPTTRSVVATIPAGSEQFEPLAANDLIWVPNLMDDSVSVIDPTSLAVIDTVSVGDGPIQAIAVDDVIWVLNQNGDSVSVIDPTTHTVDATITVGDAPLHATAAHGLVWVPNLNDDSVSVIDPTTRTVIDTITVGDGPVQPLAAHDLIWVPNGSEDTVSVIDPTGDSS